MDGDGPIAGQHQECVIVGGGIHGTYVARDLLDSGISEATLTVVDPHEQLLAAFRQNAHDCGTETLRSSFVHHLGSDPFSLEAFATERGREDELVATVDYPARPSLSLFLDHAESVIDDRGIEAVHEQATVEAIGCDGDRYRIETTTGPVTTANVVLALGHGGRYRYPEWADIERVTHVWDGFDPADGGERIVVGGGITAVTLACTLTGQGEEPVTLLTRHPLEWAVAEADPPWITWSHIEETLHTEPPGSKARFDTVQAAENSTTIPPYQYHDLDRRLDDGSLVIERGEVDRARLDKELSLQLRRGKRLTADRAVLATGFEPVFDHPLVERTADDLGLERGYRDMPVLDDETLAWHTTSGECSNVFVTGALAIGTVGPLASNLPGARRASERITGAIETDE